MTLGVESPPECRQPVLDEPMAELHRVTALRLRKPCCGDLSAEAFKRRSAPAVRERRRPGPAGIERALTPPLGNAPAAVFNHNPHTREDNRRNRLRSEAQRDPQVSRLEGGFEVDHLNLAWLSARLY